MICVWKFLFKVLWMNDLKNKKRFWKKIRKKKLMAHWKAKLISNYLKFSLSLIRFFYNYVQNEKQIKGVFDFAKFVLIR